MKKRSASILIGFVTGLVMLGLFVAVGEVREVHAQTAELARIAQESQAAQVELIRAMHEAQTAAESGRAVHAEFTCNGTAQEIAFTGGFVLSYYCEVDDAAAAAAFIGDSTVTTSDYGATKTAGEEWGGDLRGEYCITDGTSVEIHCRASLRKF